ncbi:DNA/RNA non-specific endonuclease [Spongiimicrobium salis]|uniref:DNA/RNA non-specific endonuclease n=1 Tax=Spongiimicrobium salis TaxID=1667022 RepID=UPI00374CE2A0
MDNSKINESSKNLEYLLDLYCFKGRPENLDTNNEVNILVNHGYTCGFSYARNQPVWTAYRVSAAKRDVDYERPQLFYDDIRLPQQNRVSDYTFKSPNGKKYDRGHMVPNFAINTQFGRLAQMETFFMSNICPQEADTNRGVWQRLEKKIVKEYGPEKDHIWILTGPIFGNNPEKIKRKGGIFVDIPESFYCILVDPVKWPFDRVSNVEFLALEIPQNAGYTKLSDKFITSIADIEEKTKIDFFPKMTKTDRNKVNSKLAKEIWGTRRFNERTNLTIHDIG